MSTQQAVWPAELLRRRNQALDRERRIRSATADATTPAGAPAVHLRLETLLAALAELPCPHGDVATTGGDHGDGDCVECHDVITPMWVAIADQEQSLRRAARRRSFRRAD